MVRNLSRVNCLIGIIIVSIRAVRVDFLTFVWCLCLVFEWAVLRIRAVEVVVSLIACGVGEQWRRWRTKIRRKRALDGAGE